MPRTVSTQPNILLIQCDQLRYDCSSSAVSSLIQIPSIDRLASEGMRFTQAFTPIPLCCPARQTLLCGKWAEVHGGLWNYDTCLPLRLFDEVTWTEALADREYALGYVGKWHVHPEKTPLDFGFSTWISEQDYHRWRQTEGLPTYWVESEHSHARWQGGYDPVELAQTKTHWYAGHAVELLSHYAQAGTPWHMRLDFEEPHLPCFPAEPFARMYPPETIPPWGSVGEEFVNKPFMQQQQLVNWEVEQLSWSTWARYISRYLGMTSQIDDAIGRVLRALDATGQEDQTIVILTSDHGDACGGHRMVDKHYIMYEDVVHVPLVIRWPRVIELGTLCHELVLNALDLPPTICQAVGLPVPPSYQGRSLMPLLHGQAPDGWRQEVVSTYNGNQFGLYTQRMLRDRRFKYVWNATDLDELYDLQEDPWELRNLVGDRCYDSLIQNMRVRLLAQLQSNGDAMVANSWIASQLAGYS